MIADVIRDIWMFPSAWGSVPDLNHQHTACVFFDPLVHGKKKRRELFFQNYPAGLHPLHQLPGWKAARHLAARWEKWHSSEALWAYADYTDPVWQKTGEVNYIRISIGYLWSISRRLHHKADRLRGDHHFSSVTTYYRIKEQQRNIGQLLILHIIFQLLIHKPSCSYWVFLQMHIHGLWHTGKVPHWIFAPAQLNLWQKKKWRQDSASRLQCHPHTAGFAGWCLPFETEDTAHGNKQRQSCRRKRHWSQESFFMILPLVRLSSSCNIRMVKVALRWPPRWYSRLR